MDMAISLKRVSVNLDGNPILRNISADLPTGRIIGLLGPSGAGKTTLIRAMLGLAKPGQGSVQLLALPAGHKDLRPQVGYVTQSPSVYPDLTIAENLDYFGTLLGINKSQIKKVLHQVELTNYSNRIVGSLSGGQKTRVSLAVALLGSPKILLLDEPTVGLDPVLRKRLWVAFKELSKQGITIVVSSHVMDEAVHCDEILFLRNGQLLATGTPKTIITKTRSNTMDDAFLKLATRGKV